MSDPNNTLGWIWRDPYHKWPDYSPRHPVQSGLCPDAENIRELSSRDVSALVIEIRDLWRLLQEREDDSIKKRNKLYFEGQRKDERISALEAEAEALHAAAEGWRKRAEAAEIDTTTYPDRYVITALAAKPSKDAGKRFWLYWSPESGDWWQWGPEARAERFETKSGPRFNDAMSVAPKAGPFWALADPATIEVRTVPAIVETRVY